MSLFLYAHLVTILPVIALGPFILLRKKGDPLHKNLGRVWALLMVVSSFLSFGIRGPEGGLSWLHGLSAFTIYSVAKSIVDIRKGHVASHKWGMVGPYIGALIAMFFALYSENRLLGSWMRSLF